MRLGVNLETNEHARNNFGSTSQTSIDGDVVIGLTEQVTRNTYAWRLNAPLTFAVDEQPEAFKTDDRVTRRRTQLN